MNRRRRVGEAILFGGVCGGSVALVICMIAALVSGGILPSGLPANSVNDALTGGVWSLAGMGVPMIVGWLLSREWR